MHPRFRPVTGLFVAFFVALFVANISSAGPRVENLLIEQSTSAPATTNVNVTIDALTNRHSISTYVYGGAYPKDAPTISDSGLIHGTFTEEQVSDETRGGWYVRQLVGAANIDGGPLFHVISGNLGYQVEHHLYPDMPSTRYAEIAPRVKAICERYELPYNTGPFLKQLGAVQRTILRLAFPGGKPRPKPGPFRGDSETAERATIGNGRVDGPDGPNDSGPEQPTDAVRVSMPKED